MMFDQDKQLSLAIMDLGVAVLLMVNIFWHLCARNWSLNMLMFNLLTTLLEITVAIFGISIFVGVDTHNISACVILAFVTTLFIFIRLVICLIKTFSKKKLSAKYENSTKWVMFWPASEVLISTLSLMLMMLIGYVLHADPA